MPSIHDLTSDDRVRISRKIENFFEFAREILDDPSILEHIPDGADVEAIPNDEREPGRRYDIETPRMVATVTPPQQRERSQAGVECASREKVLTSGPTRDQ
ncbi:MAG: hypothetical protein H0W06_05230 [Chloroflexia bacterium]|nr:hypothetical protein [Chloroflexia bacterium]